MVQSMRSGTMVQSGELAGCIGCHQSRLTAVPEARRPAPLAMTRSPSVLQGWKGEPRLFSYIDEVQPVFDRYCVRCHDYGREAGETLNLARDRTNTFNTSYNELWRKHTIAAIGGGPAEIQQAYSWGSHASRLVNVIRDGHEDVELPTDDFERIVTWIDINGPYYPRYDTAYPDNLAGRSPLNNAQMQRLSELTGVPLAKLARHNTSRGPQLSFDRPELSPALAPLKERDGPNYREALAIVRAGRLKLQQQPRADMPGFQPCPIDRDRQRRYMARREIEARNRKAISENNKLYDKQELE